MLPTRKCAAMHRVSNSLLNKRMLFRARRVPDVVRSVYVELVLS